VYRNTNSSVLHVDLVPTHYFARHPRLLRTRGSYESLAGPKDEVNIVWPAGPTPGVNRGYQRGVLRADGTLATYTSAAAPTVYRGDRLPLEFAGNVLVCEAAANVVSRIVLEDDGLSLSARKAYDNREFLTSTDERFRPVYLSSAPDGTLYVVDMYRGIIQHHGYITEYLRDHILAHKLEQPIGRGRIFRVVHNTTRRGPKPSLSRASGAELVKTLSHPNGWWRDTAQRLIVERGDKSVAAALQSLAAGAAEVRTRLHALWTLDGLGNLNANVVRQALTDSSKDVRVSAVRLAERWLSQPDAGMESAVLALMSDPNPAVWRQLSASLGALPAPRRDTALTAMLERHADDPIAMDAAISGLAGHETTALDLLLQRSDDTPQRRAAVTMIAATIVRGGADTGVEDLFAKVAADTRAPWQRSALLAGAEVALLDAAMPGSQPRRPSATDEAAPCSNCDGARAGPGGAPAFPTQPSRASGQAPTAAANGASGTAGRAGRGGVSLRLTREPALTAVASRGQDELSQRAANVLARVEWPGKQGAKPPVAPLTPAEQQRFEAGKEIYQNLCQACHQPDGRGMDKVAPSLIGSEFALAAPAVVVRIVLNGKEGTVGLMPPLGPALNDDQIAGALTYIRREWGQTGTPIDAATVKQIRALTAGRTRPWTPQELVAIRDGN
jgi:mono/diheme cytochrome c family protein